MRCFFSEDIDKKYITLDDSERYHLFRVLRGKIGVKVEIIDGRGGLAIGVVEEGEKIEIIERKRYSEPSVKIELFFAIPKGGRVDTILTQCTECGVWGLHPIITEHSEVSPRWENLKKRWRKKVIEACKQSKNPFLPKVFAPIRLEEALAFSRDSSDIVAFFGETSMENRSLTKILQFYQGKIAWIVGPEGGFTEDEKRDMIENGVTGISIGNYVMRVETACTAGISIINFLLKQNVNIIKREAK